MKNKWLTKSILGIGLTSLLSDYGFSLMCLGFIFEPPKLWAMFILFSLAGIYIAIVDSMERALSGDLLPENLRGTGYGALSMVNGVGDFISSFVVGILWTKVSPAAGFLYAGFLTLIGGIFLITLKQGKTH